MKRTGWLFCLMFGVTILAGCGGDEDHVNIFHAVFTANGNALDYTTTIGFTNIGIGGYSIAYSEDRNNPTGKNYLQINLPANVKAGDVFTHPSASSLILYQDAQGNWHDARNNNSTMRIEVTSWQIGGYGKGTFTATLIDDFGNPAVIIPNGTFEGFIHN